MTDSILVVNAGSSSIKYQLFEFGSDPVLASGAVERIGLEGAKFHHTGPNGRVDGEADAPDHRRAMMQVIKCFADLGPSLAEAGIVAVGHRVVMGGRELDRPVVITDEVVTTIESLSALAPLHNPANVAAINVARRLLDHIPHIAVFDTGFFHTLPTVAATYAIDLDLAQQLGIRRYGFHGISHEYVSGRVTHLTEHLPSCRDRSGPLRQIVLHLGNGASASAVVDGRPVDTSMGFTPLEGLVMGTRSGDIDPGVVFHLHRRGDMDVDEIDSLLNHRSGLLGIGGQADMRDLHREAAQGNERAGLALDVYVHRLRKYVGAYAAVMGGLDALAFTAGVGENDSVVRSRVCEGLGFLGVDLDPLLNESLSQEERFISTSESRVVTLVVPTREELSIAHQTAAAIRADSET